MWLLPLLIVGASVVLSWPTGLYLAGVMDGRCRPPGPLRRLERLLDTGPQDWKGYAIALLLFNLVMFLVGFAALALQPLLPLNPDQKGMLGPSTIFHTSISFFANNSQQHYAGEQHLSHFSQLVAILWNMFVGGGTGLAALAAVIRGLRGDAHLGNFYLDLWRAVAYVLLPFSLVVSVLLIAAGSPMTFAGAAPCGAQTIPLGPVAALASVKNLASVGGGFYAANSAHPLENPDAFSNVVQCLSVLLFPCSAFVMFGRMIGRLRQGLILYAVMLTLFVVLVGVALHTELQPSPALAEQPARTIEARDGARVMVKKIAFLPALPVEQDDGNLEGKELRFGGPATATYVAATTAVSCGSVDCMHDSLNPLTGLTALAGMWLNCAFGGKGVGLVNLLVFVLIAVFLTGLMVGRTPEYLGRKVEAREMKLAMLALLSHPVLILVPAGLFAATDWGPGSISNPGPHGFSQIVYEFTSAEAGNGSGFEGLGDTWGFNDPAANSSAPAPYSLHWDVACGLVILLGRFLPVLPMLALAGGMAQKTAAPPTVGTLRTDTATFGVVLLVVVLLLGALLYLPLAALGPVAEHLGPIPFGR